jgi:hypothetical protein
MTQQRIKITPVSVGRNSTAVKTKPATPAAPAAKASATPSLPQSVRDFTDDQPQNTAAEPAHEASDAFAPQPSFDSSYQSVGLPTNFRFYDFQTMHIKPLGVRDQILIYNGRVTNNLRHTVSAISNCCQLNAMDFTVGDFWFLMYHERIVSYKKSPFSVEWSCDNGDHQMKVMNNELDASTLSQSSFVKSSDLKIIEIGDWDMDSTIYVEFTLSSYGLTMDKVRSVTAMIRHDNGTNLYDFTSLYLLLTFL